MTEEQESLTAAQREALEKLREPFPAEEIHQLPKAGLQLDYVGHASTTDRILEADPAWKWEPPSREELDCLVGPNQPALVRDSNGNPIGLWIKLTIAGVTRFGYGSVTSKKDEAIKELIGDAIRNAAMRFGVALELWKKQDAQSAKSGAQRPSQASRKPEGAKGAQVASQAPQTASQAKTPEGKAEGQQLPGHLKRLWALASALGLSNEEVHERCGVASLHELSKDDAREMADLWQKELNARAKEQAAAHRGAA